MTAGLYTVCEQLYWPIGLLSTLVVSRSQRSLIIIL